MGNGRDCCSADSGRFGAVLTHTPLVSHSFPTPDNGNAAAAHTTARARGENISRRRRRERSCWGLGGLRPRFPPSSPVFLEPKFPVHGRLQRVCLHVLSAQSLNEVFAENLQFPHGLNLAKIAFLTLLGFNSNKPPLYYGTRSHCLDTARKSFIRRENREEGKERKEGRKRGGGRRVRQTSRAAPLTWGTRRTLRAP